MIKAVIFDFFGVLVTEGFKLFCDTYFPDDKVRRSQALELVRSHDAGRISKAQYITGLATLAGVSEKVVHDHMSGNQPNQTLLSYIKNELKLKYKVGILSNSGDNYVTQILNPEDVKLFDDVILSYRYGVTKPQAEIFELAARRLGVLAQDCVFIDDASRHCDAAKAVGMKAIWYQSFQQMKPELDKLLAA